MHNNDFKPSKYLERSILEGDISNIRGALLGIVDAGGSSQELEAAVRYVEGKIPQNQLFETDDPGLEGSDLDSDYYYIRSVLGQNFSRRKLDKLETLIGRKPVVRNAQAPSSRSAGSGWKQNRQKKEYHGNYVHDESCYANQGPNNGSVKKRREDCVEKIYRYAHSSGRENNWRELYKYLYNGQFDDLYEAPVPCPCIEDRNNWRKGFFDDGTIYLKALSELLRMNFSRERKDLLEREVKNIMGIKN